MPSSTCHLPNGQTFSVTPVFGGVTFKSNDMNLHHSVFPPGWTIVIQTEKPIEDGSEDGNYNDLVTEGDASSTAASTTQDTTPQGSSSSAERPVKTYRFSKPTLRNDYLFLSSIVNPSSNDFKPATSPTRQIAMMLWASLWWYFHEPEPDLHLTTEASAKTPELGKPKGDWRINIRREGIFRGRNLLQKLERMGMIASEDSSVGLDASGTQNSPGWDNMFISRRTFWQLDPRIFLFTLSPAGSNVPASPSLPPHHSSRPSSPCLASDTVPPSPTEGPINNPPGPFTSGSHLPTYFPPQVTQYTFTNGVRHPIRPKPPRQGEVFYTRYIPSVDQYLSFRVPKLPAPKATGHHHASSNSSTLSAASAQSHASSVPSDLDLLHQWMNEPRVNAAWGMAGPHSVQEEFLREGLTSRHSFPVFGCWDGKPFGYFEIYWVKEDRFGSLLGGNVDNYDRGLHVLVGEQEYRGAHRVAIWLSALVHYCWLADMRTQTVMLEPRVDNINFINHLHRSGFYKEGEVSFPHKQSAVMKIKRDSWEAPAL
ncbi:hypothetical protein DTO207G8_4243 [Paecilomyces variotii]|nr:hypothetical protein DTO169C6_6517 [Paecilomyces variotii]KAJ9253236.1 hypothetical protein DTO207G8_4243 [Paecilomyces variotii]KAJ9305987.1 hypothetical protein DTO217A2_4459 [Paecilomyces variotii]